VWLWQGVEVVGLLVCCLSGDGFGQLVAVRKLGNRCLTRVKMIEMTIQKSGGFDLVIGRSMWL